MASRSRHPHGAYLGVVHEVKKSAAKEEAHVAQVQFYLYVLRKNGIKAEYGLLEYPKLRQTERVELDSEGEEQVAAWVAEVARIVESERCPPALTQSKCRSCSYYDFCWASEMV